MKLRSILTVQNSKTTKYGILNNESLSSKSCKDEYICLNESASPSYELSECR